MKIKTSIYRPKKAYKGAILIVHGMCEHRRRYDEFARFLCHNGYGVVTFDQLGHGESVSDTFGYFGKDGWNNLCNTTINMLEVLKREFKDGPYYLFAHSMGTIVVRSVLKTHSKEVDGVILSGAPCYNKLASVAKLTCKTIASVRGDKNRSRFLESMVVGRFNKEIKNPRTDSDWLSFNEENVDRYLADASCGQTFTNRGFYDLVCGLIALTKTEEYVNVNRGLPIHFMAGLYDPCVGHEEGLEQSKMYLQQAGFEDVTSKFYANSRHEILNDNDAKEVYDDVLAWLKVH